MTGDTWVIYKGGAKYSTATIRGEVAGATVGQVAEAAGQPVPLQGRFQAGSSAPPPNGTTNSYTFRARPTLATRYKVELLASAGASTPL